MVRGQSNVECEEAWAAEYDGDDDTVNETAILEQSWCQEHLDMVEVEQETDQMEAEQDLETVEGAP